MEKRVLNYRIIIEPEQYPNGSIVYVAQCPTLGISDYGDSIEDVLKSIQDGIELAVESLTKKGEEVEDISKPVTLACPKSVNQFRILDAPSACQNDVNPEVLL